MIKEINLKLHSVVFSEIVRICECTAFDLHILYVFVKAVLMKTNFNFIFIDIFV